MARSQPTPGGPPPKSLVLSGVRGATPWEQAQLEKLGSEVSPKFLVATRTDGDDFKKVKSILFARHIEGVYGEMQQISKMRNGSLLIKTSTSDQVTKLKTCSNFGDIPVKVEEHKTLNYIRGVIFNRDLLLNTDAELEDDMKRRGVVAVRRFTRKVNGEDVETGAFLITFNLPVLPEKIKATSYRCEVRPYFPPPMRCFNCQRFGHMLSRCSNPSICGSCGRGSHGAESCTTPPVCTNCPGSHSPRDRNCPVFLSEKKIQELRTLERLSYQEARRKFNALNAPSRVLNYSAIGASLSSSSGSFPTMPARIPPSASTVPAAVQDKPVPVPKNVPKSQAAVASTGNPAKQQSPKAGTSRTSASKRPAQANTKQPAQPGKKAKATSPKGLVKPTSKPAEAASSTKAGKPASGQSTVLPKAGKKSLPRKEDFLKNPTVVSPTTAGSVEESAPAPAPEEESAAAPAPTEASKPKPPRSPRRRSPRPRRSSRSSSGSSASNSPSTGEEMEVADSEGSDL